MTTNRLPWEIVETLPSTDRALIDLCDRRVLSAATVEERVVALVGRALAHYWAPAMGATDDSWEASAQRRHDDIQLALGLARDSGDAELVATASLGRLYATWGPPDPVERRTVLDELERLRPSVGDRELRIRIVEWQALDCFDAGDLAGVRRWIDEFLREAAGVDSKLFARREVLWRANIEMLEGNLDEAVRLNEEAIASTADLAGSPFSFQNVAITMAIAAYFRRELADGLDAIRSIRASSARVEANWDVGLTFALSEVGEVAEARARFEDLARNRFAAVPRDLNWLVAMQLLGLIAVNLDDRVRAAELLEELRPHATLDGTHGSGYASYGPVGRVVGLLAAAVDAPDEAGSWFDFVLGSRPPGPWVALTRLDRAALRHRDDPEAALEDAERAEAELRRFGIYARADAARELAVQIRLEGHGGPVARLSDGTWTLTHPSGRAEIRDGVGMGYLCRLLRHPGERLDAVDLDERIDPSLPRDSVVEPSIDRGARAAYRRRLEELDAMSVRTRRLESEREFLLKELAGASHPASASREIERARVRVTTAIRRAIASVGDGSPALGEHLSSSVQTGRRCSYQPRDGVAWRIER
jgi:tetratricopeptide (TPR) repeat protein